MYEIADTLALGEDEFTPDQRDYFELLCALIEAYDAQIPKKKVRGLDMLKHLLEAHDLNGADLSRILGGSRNLGPMILREERNLTLEHIRVLAKHFNIDPGLLVN